MTWRLASAEARANTYASFKIPSRADRESLRVGDLAKLVFVDDGVEGSELMGERMWVEIMTVGADCYQGRLQNAPVVIRDLEAGVLVEFGPEHVADFVDRPPA